MQIYYLAINLLCLRPSSVIYPDTNNKCGRACVVCCNLHQYSGQFRTTHQYVIRPFNRCLRHTQSVKCIAKRHPTYQRGTADLAQRHGNCQLHGECDTVFWGTPHLAAPSPAPSLQFSSANLYCRSVNALQQIRIRRLKRGVQMQNRRSQTIPELASYATR